MPNRTLIALVTASVASPILPAAAQGVPSLLAESGFDRGALLDIENPAGSN
jgi:hypothetical protein